MSRMLRYCSLLLLLVATNVSAGLFDKFIDPQTGDFDTSNWLLEHRGILPVPIIISDPAVGYGLGVAGAYFHRRKDGDDLDEDGVPLHTPSVSALAAAYTENDSWFVGGGHLGIWKDDHVRYTGVLGYADLNLAFYAGNQSDGFDGFDFEIQGTFIDQELIDGNGKMLTVWACNAFQTTLNAQRYKEAIYRRSNIVKAAMAKASRADTETLVDAIYEAVGAGIEMVVCMSSSVPDVRQGSSKVFVTSAIEALTRPKLRTPRTKPSSPDARPAATGTGAQV